MRVEKKTNQKQRKRTIKKTLKFAPPIIVVLIILILLLVPVVISSEKGNRMILARINRSITGKADFADLSIGWFKGVKVDDLSFSDQSSGISVDVERFSAKPSYSSILTGSLSLGLTIIDKPQIEINLEDLRDRSTVKTTNKQPAPGTTTPAFLPLKKINLVLNDGNIKVSDPKSGTVELSQINSTINLKPLPEQSDFGINMTVAKADSKSQVKASGKVTRRAKKGWSLKDTSGELTVEVKDLDLESLGPIFALAGLDVDAKGIVNGTTTGRIKEGQLDNLNTNIKAKNLDVTAAQLKGDRLQTSDLDISAKLSQNNEIISIENLQISSDWATANAAGTVPANLESAGDFLETDSNYNLKGDFNFDLAAIAAQLPRTLGLKGGTQVTSGRLIGKVETVTGTGRKQIRADAIVADLKGAVDGKETALSESISAETLISSDKSGITFDNLDVTAPFAKVNCTGRLESLKYDADVNLAKLQSELGQFVNLGKYEMAGEFLSKGRVSVKEDKVTASGSSTLTNLQVSSQDGQSVSEPETSIDFSVNVDRKDSFVSVETFNADASFGQVSISNGILPINEKASKAVSATVSANNVDLGKLLPFGVMFASLPKEMKLSGIANSTLSVAADEGVYKIKTDDTRVDDLRLHHPDANKPFEPNYVTLAFDTEYNSNTGGSNIKSLVLDSPLVKIVKSQFILSKDDKTTRLSGQADLDYEWSEVSTVAAPFLPEGLTLEGKRRDAINFHSEYSTTEPNQLLPNLNAQAQVGFERAVYMGLNVGTTKMDIQVDKGVLKIPPITTTANGGQFSFAGQVDFNEKEPLFRLIKPMQIMKDVKINDEMTNNLLKYVNPIFADAVNVSGIANFNCEQLAIPLKAESKNKTVAIGTISMDRVRLQGSNLVGQILTTSGGDPRGTDITIHPTRFALQKGFLRYDDMQVDVGDNPVNFKGVIGLDKSLDMTATLPYTTGGRTTRVGRETKGRRISLPIKGSVDKPELDLGMLLEQQLKGELEEQLQKALEDLFK